MPQPTFKPIEDHGIIGNMCTVALVSTAAVVDFLCLPEFDSPSVFASLLDLNNGGYFAITPLCDEYRSKQMYLPETNILTTRFLSDHAVVEIVDYMPVEATTDRHRLVRTVRGIRGPINLRIECRPRFDYGRTPHTAQSPEPHVVEFQGDANPEFRLRLTASTPLTLEDGDVAFDLTLNAGDEVCFVLEYGGREPVAESDLRQLVEALFRDTTNYWHAWLAKSTYRGRWRETVNRSALVLKLLTSRKYGSIVAAPTFGLPEGLGGVRNWDYRYSWIRDSAFTIYAFIRLGYVEEARHFLQWLKDRIERDKENGPLHVMYRLDGGELPEELSLDNLEGYANSKPVRIGNAASKQLQLDIYGELLDAVYLATKYGDGSSYDGWKNVCSLVEWVGQNWQRPDEGMWEIRGERRQFLHSRVMCWVTVDRALRLADKRSLPAPFGEWQKLRTEIYESVFADYWNEELNSFVSYPGGNLVDGSILLMPLVRFISPIDRHWLGTLDYISKELSEDVLIYRYKETDGQLDGLRGVEGTFAACSFWYIECLARSHRMEEARLYFERMITYSNHLGLYAEEIGPNGAQLGNFPQAFTHLALISAATFLDRHLDEHHPAEWQ